MNIQSKFLVFGNYCCLLWCYCRLTGISIMQVFEDFEALVKDKILDNECTVLDADKLIRRYGVKNKLVVKAEKNPHRGEQAARFTYVDDKNKSHSHWVIVDDNDNVMDNSLDFSNCVARGKIDSYRAIV